MRESPRLRRLRTDRKSLEALCADSSIVSFESFGAPPEAYLLRFCGRGLARPDPTGPIVVQDVHEVSIRLGASYPRAMPELQWRTPIFHPNISGAGVVCLGGYGTHWVPSLNLDELCDMLWEMIRYKNFDVTSPYNRAAADWAANQTSFDLPTDDRPIRDKVAFESSFHGPPPLGDEPILAEEVVFLGDVTEGDGDEDGRSTENIVMAELADDDSQDILFIE